MSAKRPVRYFKDITGLDAMAFIDHLDTNTQLSAIVRFFNLKGYRKMDGRFIDQNDLIKVAGRLGKNIVKKADTNRPLAEVAPTVREVLYREVNSSNKPKERTVEKKRMSALEVKEMCRQYEAQDNGKNKYKLEYIRDFWTSRGYVDSVGCKIYTSWISLTAHANGCAKRINRRKKDELLNDPSWFKKGKVPYARTKAKTPAVNETSVSHSTAPTPSFSARDMQELSSGALLKQVGDILNYQLLPSEKVKFIKSMIDAAFGAR